MEQQTKGIVFQTIKFKDHQFIVRIFTERFGLKSFLVRSGKSPKSNLSSYLQPLTIVEFNAHIRENRDLATWSNVRVAVPYMEIPFNPVKSSIALFLNEVLYKTMADEYRNEELFHFITHALQWLDHSSGARNFHLWFLMELTKYYGFFPSEGENGPDTYFDLAQGQFTSVRPVHRHYLEGKRKQQWKTLMEHNFDTVNEFSLTGTERHEILETLVLYIRLHLDSLREIKSLDVLHEVFTAGPQ